MGVVCARVGITARHLARKCSGTRKTVVVVRKAKTAAGTGQILVLAAGLGDTPWAIS